MTKGSFVRARWLVLLSIAVALVAAGGSGGRAAVQVRHDTTLPTWRNLYDWPNGHGYAGWHSASSSPDDYGMQPALGDQPGLWLWPVGGHKAYNTGDYAEWTYTAPGTTRLSSAVLSYAWSNKLLAHHCIDIGFRDGSGNVITHQEACKPPPQSPNTITLTDPASNPVSTVLYFRIVVDCGGAQTCSKTIPSLDPLKNGAYARLLKADLTLVDDDQPVPAGSGPFHDLDGLYIDGHQTYDLTVSAHDDGAGLVRLWAEVLNGATLASHDSPCDPTHHTDALDARICPSDDKFSTSVDTSGIPEGETSFDVAAVDPAGNIGKSAPWRVRVDRTAPTPASDIHLSDFDSSTGTATFAWTPGVDPDLPGGIPGSGANGFAYRISHDGGSTWGDWTQTDTPDGAVDQVALGDVFDVQVQSADDVGNISDPVSATLTVFSVNTPPDYSSTTADTETTASLSPDDATRAEQLATSDALVTDVSGGQALTTGDPVPWVADDGSIVGTRLEVSWANPVTAERDWPVISFGAGGSYTSSTLHYLARNVTSLLVAVDLTKNTVVAAEPSGDAQIDEQSFGVRAARTTATTAANAVIPTDATSPTAIPDPGTNPEGENTVARGVNLRHITSSLVPQVGGDAFWNWDFHHTSIPPYSANAVKNVDWPINLIFWNNADVQTAKSLWNRGAASVPGGYFFATAQYGRVWDGGSQPAGHIAPTKAVWDSDRGTYTGVVCVGHKWHYRVYAPSPAAGGDDRMYNLSWGYYVIASSHQDHHDNWKKQCYGDWYGGSEDAEHKVAAAAPGHTVIFFSSAGPAIVPDPWVVEDATTGAHQDDTLNLYNKIAKPHWIGNRFYQNDGMATMIRVDHRLCDVSYPSGQSQC
jgi:hypothetical protein